MPRRANMMRVLALLTAWNLICPIALAALSGLAALFDLSLGGGGFMDVAVFLLAWAWLLGTPVVSIVAAVLARALRSRPLLLTNLAVVALWAAGATYLLFLVPSAG